MNETQVVEKGDDDNIPMDEERHIQFERGFIRIPREVPRKEWMRCTEGQWEKKAELSQLNGKMWDALKYADFANCIAYYKAGLTVKEIEKRKGDE